MGCPNRFQRLPRVERIIYLPQGDENKWVQLILANQMDQCIDLRPSTSKPSSTKTPTSPRGRAANCPTAIGTGGRRLLGFNNLEPPFDDPDIRWAVNHAIDREQLVAIGWQGAGEYTLLPFPHFPPLMHYIDQVQDLLAKYPVGQHDLAQTAAIMESKGWTRDSEGMWNKNGERLKIPVVVFPSLFQDFTPVLVEQLRRAGFDSSFRMFSDAYTRMTQGTARAFIMGNGGSVRDPYFTLRLYHSRYVQPTGTATPSFWRWRNADFDRLVDQMGQTAPTIQRSCRYFAKPSRSGWPNCRPFPSSVVPPHPPQPDLLEKLAFGRKSLHEQRLLGTLVLDRAVGIGTSAAVTSIIATPPHQAVISWLPNRAYSGRVGGRTPDCDRRRAGDRVRA